MCGLKLQEEVEALAQSAFRTLCEAQRNGKDGLAQCPVEAVLQYNMHAAERLQQLIEAKLTDVVILS